MNLGAESGNPAGKARWDEGFRKPSGAAGVAIPRGPHFLLAGACPEVGDEVSKTLCGEFDSHPLCHGGLDLYGRGAVCRTVVLSHRLGSIPRSPTSNTIYSDDSGGPGDASSPRRTGLSARESGPQTTLGKSRWDPRVIRQQIPITRGRAFRQGVWSAPHPSRGCTGTVDTKFGPRGLQVYAGSNPAAPTLRGRGGIGKRN